MKLGTEAGLDLGHIVLDGDPAPSPKRGTLPIFSTYLLWSNGWMDQDATRYGGRPQPRSLCVRWGPSPLHKMGGAPNFGPSLLWPHGCMDQDATWYGGRPRPRRHCTQRFITILPNFQTLSCNRHFALLSSPDFHAVIVIFTGVMLYVISELFAICCRRPSVCNARAHYSSGCKFFYGIWYLGHPLTYTENFTEIVPGEPLRRGS